MDASSLDARIRRLGKLSAGLSIEISLIRKGTSDPLYWTERQAYLSALHDVVRSLESARIALVMAKQRLERGDTRLKPDGLAP